VTHGAVCAVPCCAAEIVFEASVVAGDYLSIAFQSVDRNNPGRQFVRVNLVTQKVDPPTNFWLVSAA
jgi:hypothetical protein